VQTECNLSLFEYARVEGRAVMVSFDGGQITSDAGALLLGAANRVAGARAYGPLDARAAGRRSRRGRG